MPAIAIEMTEWDYRLADCIASQRDQVNRKNNVFDLKGDRNPANRIEVNGLLGEICFGKWANAYLDLTWKPRSGGADFIIDGKTYDVKNNRRVGGDMNVNYRKKNNPCDYYVLVTGIIEPGEEKGTMYIEGFVRPRTIFKEENRKDNQGSIYYQVKRQSMRRFKKQ